MKMKLLTGLILAFLPFTLLADIQDEKNKPGHAYMKLSPGTEGGIIIYEGQEKEKLLATLPNLPNRELKKSNLSSA